MNPAKYVAPLFASFLGFLAGANVASANTFVYDGYNVVNAQFVLVQQVYANTPLPGDGLGMNMGQIILQGSGPNAGQELFAWCLDPIPEITPSGSYNVQSAMPTWAGAPASPLTQAQTNQIASLMQNGAAVASGGNVYASAAIQLAIWRIEHGPSFKFITSDFVADLAATYMGYVDGGIWSSTDNIINWLTSPDNPGSQILGYATPAAAPAPTPLPSTIVLFGSVLGAGYFGWRRSRAKLRDTVVKAT